MAGAQLGDKVKFLFTLTDEKGKIFDQSKQEEPDEIILGEGEIPPGVEVSLVGMKKGESKSVTLKPNMHFGPRIDTLKLDMEKSQLPDNIKLEKNSVIEFEFDDGATGLFTIVSIGDEMVTLDGNHPLAGQEITCELKVVDLEHPSQVVDNQ